MFPREVPDGFPDKAILLFSLTTREVRQKYEPIWQTLLEAWSWPLAVCRTCKGRVTYRLGRTKDCQECRRDYSKQQRWYSAKRKIPPTGRSAP